MKQIISLVALAYMVFASMNLNGQVGVNSDGSAPHASAMLEVKSNNKGLLIPRLTTAQRNTLAATATAGLMVYDTDLNKFFFYNGAGWNEGATGYFWDGNGTNVYLGDINDFVGIGTTSPSRKFEINGGWKSFRLNTNDSGPFIEFTGSDATDWMIGSWSGLFWLSTTTDNFASWTDQFFFSTYTFRPMSDNSKSLGEASARWSNTYSVDGNFSGLLTGNTGNFSGLFTGNTGYFSGSVGVGASSPARKFEVNAGGAYKVARLTSTSSGTMLELDANFTPDWAIGTWTGTLRILSSSDDLANLTDEYLITTTEFRPWTTNSKSLGTSNGRWSAVYSVEGNYSGLLTGAGGYFSGDFGIGTASPARKLEVNAGGAWRSARITSTNSGAFLEFVSGANPDWAIGTWGNSLRMLSSTDDFSSSTDEYYFTQSGVQPVSNNTRTLGTSSARWSHLYCTDAHMYGTVAIGSTTATGYKLSVEGKIICTELRVDQVVDWPDYVFRDDYQLMPLDHLRAYIKSHGHLPNVPSADKVHDAGMDVGEMQKLMMEKIEELSLYILQQQEEIEALKSRIEHAR